MSKNRISAQAGYVDHRALPKGPTGRPMCRQCAKEVPSPRRSYCSDKCVHEWQLKTNTGYVRACVLERDKGICAQCSIDTEKLRAEFFQLRMANWRAKPYGVSYPELKQQAIDWCAPYGVKEGEMDKSWWQADHIVPVAEGGGECDLANYQTLCLKCHKVKTAEQARRRALARRIPPLFTNG